MNFSKKCKSKYGLGDLFTKIKLRLIVNVKLAYEFFVGFLLLQKIVHLTLYVKTVVGLSLV